MGARYTKNTDGTVAKKYFGSVLPAGVAFQIVQDTDGRPDSICEGQAMTALNNGATSAYCFTQTDAQAVRTAVLGGTCTAGGTTVCETPRARTNAESRFCANIVEVHKVFAGAVTDAENARAEADEAAAAEAAAAAM